jgi:hypothetical protein
MQYYEQKFNFKSLLTTFHFAHVAAEIERERQLYGER